MKSKQSPKKLNEFNFNAYNYVKPKNVNETQQLDLDSDMNLDLEKIAITSQNNFPQKVNSDFINSTIDYNQFNNKNNNFLYSKLNSQITGKIKN